MGTFNKSDLAGKLKEVQMGDLIIMQCIGAVIETSGYVVGLRNDYIELSHEHPKSRDSLFQSGRKGFGRGDRTYNLGEFETYKVVLKANAPRPSGIMPISKGDLVMLENPGTNIEVAGYVKNLAREEIRLSHESPKCISHLIERGRLQFTRADKTYDLRRFTRTHMLREKGPECRMIPL